MPSHLKTGFLTHMIGSPGLGRRWPWDSDRGLFEGDRNQTSHEALLSVGNDSRPPKGDCTRIGALKVEYQTLDASVLARKVDRAGRRRAHGVTENRVDLTWHDTDIAVVSLVGEHDLSTATQLQSQLELLLRGREAVIVYLSAAEFIDSSVLNNLVRADKLARQQGTRLTLLLETAPAVVRLLEIAGLDGYFVLAGSREEAIAAARNPGAWATVKP